jgi:hypothetical protein
LKVSSDADKDQPSRHATGKATVYVDRLRKPLHCLVSLSSGNDYLAVEGRAGLGPTVSRLCQLDLPLAEHTGPDRRPGLTCAERLVQLGGGARL